MRTYGCTKQPHSQLFLPEHFFTLLFNNATFQLEIDNLCLNLYQYLSLNLLKKIILTMVSYTFSN